MIDRNDCDAIICAVGAGDESDPYLQAILREIERFNRRLEAQTVFLGHFPPVFVTPPFVDAIERVAFDLWTASVQQTLDGEDESTLVIDVSMPPWPTAALSSALH